MYVRQHQVEPFFIPSSGMEPSVLRGDRIFADKRYNCPGCQQGMHRSSASVSIRDGPCDRRRQRRAQ